jgi:hypothetical protein
MSNSDEEIDYAQKKREYEALKEILGDDLMTGEEYLEKSKNPPMEWFDGALYKISVCLHVGIYPQEQLMAYPSSYLMHPDTLKGIDKSKIHLLQFKDIPKEEVIKIVQANIIEYPKNAPWTFDIQDLREKKEDE